MSERAQRLSLLLSAIGLTIGIAAALRYVRTRPLFGLQPSVGQPIASNISLAFEEVEATGYEKSKRAWTLQAPQIEGDQSHDRLLLTGGVRATVYEGDQTRATVIAPTATYLRSTQRIEFSGGMTATLQQENKPRATLTAPTAIYEAGSKRFHALGGIKLVVQPPVRESRDDLPKALGVVTLQAPELISESASKLVKFPGTATLTSARRDEVRGENLTLNLETHAMTFQNLRGRIFLPEEE